MGGTLIVKRCCKGVKEVGKRETCENIGLLRSKTGGRCRDLWKGKFNIKLSIFSAAEEE